MKREGSPRTCSGEDVTLWWVCTHETRYGARDYPVASVGAPDTEEAIVAHRILNDCTRKMRKVELEP